MTYLVIPFLVSFAIVMLWVVLTKELTAPLLCDLGFSIVGLGCLWVAEALITDKPREVAALRAISIAAGFLIVGLSGFRQDRLKRKTSHIELVDQSRLGRPYRKR